MRYTGIMDVAEIPCLLDRDSASPDPKGAHELGEPGHLLT